MCGARHEQFASRYAKPARNRLYGRRGAAVTISPKRKRLSYDFRAEEGGKEPLGEGWQPSRQSGEGRIGKVLTV